MNNFASRRPLRLSAAGLLGGFLACSAALLAVSSSALPSATDAPKESWTGLYFNARKIGYTHTISEPTTWAGKAALKLVTTSRTHLEMFGNTVTQSTSGTMITDTSYRPLFQDMTIVSNGSKVHIKADYQPGKILCTVDAGAKPVTKVVSIPKGANLSADPSDGIQGKQFKPGEKMSFYFLEPMSVSLVKSDIEVQAKEQVTLSGQTTSAYRVRATTPFGVLVSWQDEKGDLLKGDMPLGMTMFRETKTAALDGKSVAPKWAVVGSAATAGSAYAPKDFALATAVTTDKPIDNPRAVRDLSLVVDGIDDPKLVLNDARQQGASAGRENAYDVHVEATRFDPAKSARLPMTNPAMADDLKPAPYLETDDPKIQKLAADLRGSETNAYRVAVKIHDWVYQHMTPDYSIGVPRSCVEINGRRRGVCRDYATLFAGIARAAGVPTRVCGGMVYAEGKFFYHAWVECWVGQWVPFDPTMKDADFVDATHVKFAEGDVTDMFRIAGVVGRIKAQVRNVQ